MMESRCGAADDRSERGSGLMLLAVGLSLLDRWRRDAAMRRLLRRWSDRRLADIGLRRS